MTCFTKFKIPHSAAIYKSIKKNLIFMDSAKTSEFHKYFHEKNIFIIFLSKIGSLGGKRDILKLRFRKSCFLFAIHNDRIWVFSSAQFLCLGWKMFSAVPIDGEGDATFNKICLFFFHKSTLNSERSGRILYMEKLFNLLMIKINIAEENNFSERRCRMFEYRVCFH